ncbi:MAG TPA: energy transducer TonB [Terriglobia bacterium]|nr:energy transducer TonB [Terriglobia bacterium]
MRKVLLGLLLIPILAAGSSTALAQKPLTQDEVNTMITSKLKSKQVIKTVQQRGVGFVVTREYIEKLKLQGVAENVLAALCVAATDPLTMDQLIVLVKSGMPDDALAALVERRRLAFKFSDDELDQLRGLGAGDRLDAALMNSKIVAATLVDGKLKQAPAGPLQAGAIQDVAGDKITPPSLVYHPTPRYTKEAREANISGRVYLRIVINDKGEVTDAKVTKGLGYGLDESAQNTVKSWKFEPARRNGTPVTVAVMVEVDFALDAEHYPGIQ